MEEGKKEEKTPKEIRDQKVKTQLADLFEYMESHLNILDRHYQGQDFARCFCGEELPKFLYVNGYVSSHTDALLLCQYLMDNKLFHHARSLQEVDDEQTDMLFRVGLCFYQMSEKNPYEVEEPAGIFPVNSNDVEEGGSSIQLGTSEEEKKASVEGVQNTSQVPFL